MDNRRSGSSKRAKRRQDMKHLARHVPSEDSVNVIKMRLLVIRDKELTPCIKAEETRTKREE